MKGRGAKAARGRGRGGASITTSHGDTEFNTPPAGHDAASVMSGTGLPPRRRQSQEEEVHANMILGPAATWSKEYLQAQKDAQQREHEAELQEAKGRIDEVMTEFGYVLDPASRPPEPPHVPGQGTRGLTMLAKQFAGVEPVAKPRAATEGKAGDAEEGEAAPAELADLKAVKAELNALLKEASTRKSEQKEALFAVNVRLDAVRERTRAERKAKAEAERKERMALRLEAIAQGKEESELDGGRSARIRKRRDKRRGTSVERPAEAQTTSAAQLAAKLVGQNQSEMTSKLFLQGMDGKADSDEEEDGLEDDSEWDSEELDEFEDGVKAALKNTENARYACLGSTEL